MAEEVDSLRAVFLSSGYFLVLIKANLIDRARKYLTRPGLGPQLIRVVVGSAGMRVAGMGLAFMAGVQLARGLGVEGYGVYGLAMSIVSVMSIPAEFGLPQLLIREVASAQVACNWGRLRGVIHWANRAALQMSLGTIFAVVAWLLLTNPNFDHPLVGALLAGLLMVPMGAFGRQRGAALLGLQRIVTGQMPEVILRPAVFSLLLFGTSLLSFKLSPGMAMLAGTASAAFAYVIASILLRAALPTESRVAVMEVDSRRWWASAFPMALTEGMRGLQGNVATLVVGAVATAETVGIFRTASAVSVMTAAPVSLFILVGAPVMSRLRTQGDQARLQRLLSWMSAGMTMGSLLLTLPFLFGGEWLIGGLFGPAFASANTPLLILCVGGIVYSAFGSSIILLNMTGHEMRVTRAFAVSVVTLIVLTGPLVHFFGANGAACSSAACLVLGNVLMWRDARKLLSLDTSLMSFCGNEVTAHE